MPENSHKNKEVLNVLKNGYGVASAKVAVESFGHGRIHNTWHIRFQDRVDWLLQGFNRHVFPEVDRVMENIRRVTEHLRNRPRAGQTTLTLIPSLDGDPAYQDEQEKVWRVFEFVEHSCTHQSIDSQQRGFQAGQMYAQFSADLADLKGPPLNETIARFHDTPTRLKALQTAIQKDPMNRAAACKSEIEALMARMDTATALTDETLPHRVVHNDTKLNNLLFHCQTKRPLCVVDLDTVMPGLLAHDFGDLVRSGANISKAGERTGEFHFPWFQAVAEGYVQGAKTILSKAEVDSLVIGPEVITLELASRFLSDHVLGDQYFSVKAAQDNLFRCQGQLQLLQQMETRRDDMAEVIHRAVASAYINPSSI